MIYESWYVSVEAAFEVEDHLAVVVQVPAVVVLAEQVLLKHLPVLVQAS